ncbi:MAG: transcription-repair coupling factor, partial [Dialister sp.]
MSADAKGKNEPSLSSVKEALRKSSANAFPLDDTMGPRLTDLMKGKPVAAHWEDRSVQDMVTGISGSQKALAAAALLRTYEQAIIIVPDQKDIFRWEEDLAFFAPDWEIHPFPLVEEAGFQVTFAGTERLRDRMQSLRLLMGKGKTVILASSVEAAQKIVSPLKLSDHALTFSMGQEVEREELLEKLVSAGYERVGQVERCGHFAVRGDIVDIFPVSEDHPVRMEFFGDEIDSIRSFDEDTQRSMENFDRVMILPMSVDEEKSSLLFDYLDHGLIIYDEPQRCEENLKRYFKEEKENRTRAVSFADMVKKGRKKENKEVIFSLLNRSLSAFSPLSQGWQGQTMTNYQRQIPIFIEDLKGILKKDWKVLFAV